MQNSKPVRIDALRYIETNTKDYINQNIFDPNGSGVVYFVETKYHGYCKIGLTSPNGFEKRIKDWLFADVIMTTWMHDPMTRLSAFLLEQCLLKITSDFAFAPYYVVTNRQPGFTELRRLPKGSADFVWQRLYLLSKLFYDMNSAKEDCVLDFLSTPALLPVIENYRLSGERHWRLVDEDDHGFEYRRMADFIAMAFKAFCAVATKHPSNFVADRDHFESLEPDGFCFHCGAHSSDCFCDTPRPTPGASVVRSIRSLSHVPM